MATIGELIINLKAETASFAGDLTRVKNLSFDTASQIQRSFNIMGAAALGMVATATGAMVAAIDKTVEFDVHILHLSQSAGVTTETMSGLSFAAKLLGMNVDEVALAMERFDKQLALAQQGQGSALKVMDRLGINPADIKTSDEALMKLADHFAAMPDGAIKSGEAMQAFGRAGAAMIPILDQGSVGIQKFMDQARQLGVIVDGPTAQAAEHFEQDITVLQTAFEGVWKQVAEQLLPTLDNFVAQLANSGPQLEAFVAVTTTAVKDLFNLGDALVFVGRSSAALWQLTSGLTPFSADKIKEFNAAINQAYEDMNRFDAFAKPTAGANQFLDAIRKTGQEVPGHLADEAAAAKKLAEQIDSVTKNLGEQVAAFGLTATAADIAKLHFLGATDAQIAKAKEFAAQLNALQRIQDAQKFAANNPFSPPGGFGPPAPFTPDPQMAEIKGQFDDYYDGVMKDYDATAALAQQIENKGAPAFDRYLKIVKQAKDAQVEFGLSDKDVNSFLADTAMQMGLLGEKGSTATEKLGRAWRQFGDGIANDLASMATGGKNFISVLQDIGKQIEELIIKQALFGSSGTGGPGSGGLFGFLGSLFHGGGAPSLAFAGGLGISPSFGDVGTADIPHFASGGHMDAGDIAIVGENGPEPFVADRSGTVIPSGTGLGGGGLTLAPVYHINAAPGTDMNMLRRALKESEDRTVARTVATMNELRRRKAGR